MGRPTGFTLATKTQAYVRDCYKCVRCGVDRLGELEVDHVTPVGLGGTHDLWNAQILCLSCHDTKSYKDQQEISRLVKLAKKRSRQAADRPDWQGRYWYLDFVRDEDRFSPVEEP